MTDSAFAKYLADAVRDAGGYLVHCAIHDEVELDPLPENRTRFKRRLALYSPYTTRPGRAVLRTWKARESMWNMSLGVERAHNASYKLVMWTRDDALWLDRVQLCPFAWQPDLHKTLFTRNCLSWDGINDKSVVMGRAAAARVMLAYTAFWDPRYFLEVDNAETYLMQWARLNRGVCPAKCLSLLVGCGLWYDGFVPVASALHNIARRHL